MRIVENLAKEYYGESGGIGGGSGVSLGFLCVKIRLVDFTIWGTPARSSKISKPRASSANTPAIGAATPKRPRIPTIPNSCTPMPAGVIGMKARAVTSGWIKKKAIHHVHVNCEIPNA